MASPLVSSILTRVVVDNLVPSNSSSTSTLNVTPVPAKLIDQTFSSSTNLSTTVLGAKVLSYSDEWFAKADNLLVPTPAVWKPEAYVDTGKWMDGWETRRHNTAEYDWVVIKLGCVGRIDAVEVDTAHFNGNEAPAAGLDGCFLTPEDEQNSGVDQPSFSSWSTILPRQNCGPSQRQAWRVAGPDVAGKEFTHLKLKMYPDGGIARLRIYGTVVPPPLPLASATGGEYPLEDLASALNGAVATVCSDQHFGVKSNLLLPGRGLDMRDGWETARSRVPGHVDWVIIKLGLRAKVIEELIADTKDFKGNFPRVIRLEGFAMDMAKAALGSEDEPSHDNPSWLPLTKKDIAGQAHSLHHVSGSDLAYDGPLEGKVWTHIKLTIIPDGGVKRLRVMGRRA